MKKTFLRLVSTITSVTVIGGLTSWAFVGVAPLAALAAPPILESGYTTNSTAGSSLTLTKPAGVQPGDLLLIFVGNDDSTSTAQWNNSSYKPAGFSLINEAGNATSDCHVAAFTRLADGSEGATVVVPAQSADDYWGYYLRITGHNVAAPINAIGSDVNVDNTKSVNVPGVNAMSDEGLAFYAHCFDGADGNPFSVSGAGWTEAAEGQTSGGSNGAGGSWGTKILAAAGATGTATVTSGAKDGWSGFQFAVAAALPNFFGSPTSYSVGSSSYDIAVGDFNNDTHADIASTARLPDTSYVLAVMLNNGDGTYGSPAYYVAGTSPYAVAVADVDNDDFVDIVVSDSGSSDSALVLINNGDGTFAASVAYAAGAQTYGVAVADINADDFADIVTTNYTPATASVLLNNGDGTFAAPVSYVTGTGTFGIQLADVDGDLVADIVTANATASTVSVLLNNGDGTFAAKTDMAVGTIPYNVAVADLNGDTALDIASANSYKVGGVGFGDSVSILLNNGDGTFASSVNYDMGDEPLDVALADVDGDGAADVLTADNDSHTVSVRLNAGDGTFGVKTSYTTGFQPVAIATADVDGDTFVDAITADATYGQISVLLNNGN